MSHLGRRTAWLVAALAVVAVLGAIGVRIGGPTDPSSAGVVGSTAAPEKSPCIDNIVVIVGDGMGPAHVEAGRGFVHGPSGTLAFQEWPFQATVTTANVFGNVSDSASSATALATGTLVRNRSISVRLPGDGGDLATALEVAADAGKATGIVTTSYVTDATPAAFAAHVDDRGDDAEIADWFVGATRLDVIVGEATVGLGAARADDAGYSVVTDRAGLADLAALDGPVAALLDAYAPPGHTDHDASMATLPEMAEAALTVVGEDPDGFFLVIEQEGTDTYSHVNDIDGVVRSVAELHAAVQVVEAFVAEHPRTLALLVADHETGGLGVTTPSSAAGELPAVSWAGTGHTAAPVDVYATGFGADRLHRLHPDALVDLHPLIADPCKAPAEECVLTGSTTVWSQGRLPRESSRRCGPFAD